jgi:site-specific recombinase XerD
MIANIFRSDFVRRRMAASHLGIILHAFVLDLHARGHTINCIQSYGQIAEHFSRWLAMRHLALRAIDEAVVEQFLCGHLSHCHCPRPAPTHRKNCRAALGRLLVFLRRTNRIADAASEPVSNIERVVKNYDHHLAEVAGLSRATRQYRCRYAREFFRTRRTRGKLQFESLSPKVLTVYVERRAQSLKPASLRVLTTSLRSLLRFLHFSGFLRQPWAQAVPSPAPWPRSSLPQILSEEQCRKFLNSFDRGTPTGRRDFAMALCLCLLGLRTHEVAALTLEDVDWRQLTVHLRRTKQQRERQLPLPARLSRALIDYLRRGRPATNARALFVRHQAPLGTPVQVHHVRGAMRRAFARCNINSGRIHLLRHTFATRLHRKGVGLKAIADLLGHVCLDTTAVYARVNLAELRQATLPWPERSP